MERDGIQCLAGWKRPDLAGESQLIPNLWEKLDAAVKGKCQSFDGDSFEVHVPFQPVQGNGFSLNGVKLFYPSAARVAVDMTVERTRDGYLEISKTTFRFSKPVLAGFNIKLRAGELFMAIATEGLAKAAERAVENADVCDFDSSAAGPLVKPVMLAADRMTIGKGKNGLKVSLYLGAKEYLARGWGIFTFGISENDCEIKTESTPSSFHLGKGYADKNAGEECRSTDAGPRIGKAIAKWMLRDKTVSPLLARQRGEGVGLVGAMTAAVNQLMGSGVDSSDDGGAVCNSWKCFEGKQNLMGEGFLRWEKENLVFSLSN